MIERIPPALHNTTVPSVSQIAHDVSRTGWYPLAGRNWVAPGAVWMAYTQLRKVTYIFWRWRNWWKTNYPAMPRSQRMCTTFRNNTMAINNCFLWIQCTYCVSTMFRNNVQCTCDREHASSTSHQSSITVTQRQWSEGTTELDITHMLRVYTSPSMLDWDKHLVGIVDAYNSTRHATTRVW